MKYIAPLLLLILLSSSANAQIFKRIPRVKYKDTIVYRTSYVDTIVLRPIYKDTTIIRPTIKDSLFFIPVYAPQAIKNATINYKISIQ